MNSTVNSKEIGREILNQLGGNKFAVMTGANNFVVDNYTLRFSIMRNAKGAKFVSVTLNSCDLYDLHFFNVNRKYEVITISKKYNVYAEDLRQIFEAETGLYTRL